MATRAQFEHIASQARRLYIEEVVKGLTPLIQAVLTPPACWWTNRQNTPCSSADVSCCSR